MKVKIIKLFLRISIAAGFLSAVADRFGFWSKEVSAWAIGTTFLIIHKH
jgi:thiosulfate dehydrogenase (quinone) large subunit